MDFSSYDDLYNKQGRLGLFYKIFLNFYQITTTVLNISRDKLSEILWMVFTNLVHKIVFLFLIDFTGNQVH